MPAKKYLSKVVKGNDDILIKDSEARTAITDMASVIQDILSYIDYDFYKDFYLGVGASEAAVKVAANYHEKERKGTKYSFTSASGKVWLIMPSTYSPEVEMSSVTVSMELDRTYTDDGVTYKVWKSTNTYSGDFNLFLL